MRLLVLLVGSLGVFVVWLDTTIVNVAFETMSRSFATAAGHLAWVLNAYSLVFAAMLIPAGRLADIFGRKRLFLTGLLGFGATSALCGGAPDVDILIAGRAMQAIFAALLVPTSLALILPEFPAERRRVAVGTWGATAAAAAACGPTIGALLVEFANWRWVFLINVPICAVVAAFGIRLLKESSDPHARRLPDPVEILLVAAIPALLSIAIMNGPDWGWTDPRVVGSFVIAAVLVPMFAWRASLSAQPVIDLALFRIRQFRLTNAATMLFGTAFYAYLLGNVLFLQTVWHYSVLRAALAIAPSALITAFGARPASQLSARIGYRSVLIAGSVLFAAGIGILAIFVGSTPHYASVWLPAALLTGLGTACSLPIQSASATHSLPPARFALGSAVNSSFRQLGAVVGVSVFVAVLGAPGRTSAISAYHRSWWVISALGLASGAIWLIPRTRRQPRRLTPAITLP